MNSAGPLYDTLGLDAENIGGIRETSVELSSGVTILEGRNATNRTSFLQAVMAGLGSDRYNLKGDADRGRVRLALDDTVVEREFDRRNGVVDSTDEGYLDDPELADLFAFLLEDNEARRAVARGEDLREIITRPIDTDEIDAEIERLQTEKRRVDERLDRIEERERDLVDLEQRKTRLETDVQERRERLEDLEADIDEADTDLETEREEKARVEEQLDKLKELRSELDDVRFRIETAEETIDSLETEREEKTEAREELTVDSDADVDDLRDELDDLREEKRRVDAQVNELGSIVQFNEGMLGGTDSEIADVLRDKGDEGNGDVGGGGDDRGGGNGANDRGDGDGRDGGNDGAVSADGSITDQLLENEDSVACWTCGSQVARADVEATLDRLRSFRQEKLSARQSLQRDIDDTKERISELEQSERELEEIDRRLAEIDGDVERKQSRVEELEARREELREEIADLEEAVEEERTSAYGEVLDLHKQANAVELEIEQKQDELESVEAEIGEIESLLEDRQEYEARRDRLTDQLEELRNRIDRLEESAVEEFNSHVADVLDVLEYENVARIWIERVERETRRGRRKVTESRFELHVVRETESGRTYEGTVDTLSESEREVLGLVFALAGYLVHDLHETVPVMLLDSLEAIDSDRIARLVEYFAEYPDFLVVALLPEDANAISSDHGTVTEI